MSAAGFTFPMLNAVRIAENLYTNPPEESILLEGEGVYAVPVSQPARFQAIKGTYIEFNKRLFEEEPVGCRFFFKREVSLIKNKTDLWNHSAAMISQIFMIALFWNTPPSLRIVALMGNMIFLRYMQRKIMTISSETIALSRSTDEELIGALKIYASKNIAFSRKATQIELEICQRLLERGVEIPAIDRDVAEITSLVHYGKGKLTYLLRTRAEYKKKNNLPACKFDVAICEEFEKKGLEIPAIDRGKVKVKKD